jgi:hypothetical protein
MAQPTTWSDVQALIGVSESDHLDFKRELPKQGHDFPKDIAAMTRSGGTIIYGVEEDKAVRMASSIAPVPIDGVEERIRQASKHVRPELKFDVDVITASPQDTSGVVVVQVPVSTDWPIMVNDRFPVRYGTTTRYLDGAEVQAAFAAKQTQVKPSPPPPARTADLFDPLVVHLPGISEIRTRSTFDGHAFVRVAVRPTSGRFEHPDGAWLGLALERARVRAQNAVAANVEPVWDPQFLNLTDDWQATGTDHWAAGYAGGDEGTLAQRARGSAVLEMQSGHLIMELTRPTGVFNQAGWFGYHCAFEPYVAAELWAMLRFAGEVFSDLPDVGSLHAGLHLAGFGECVSHHATHAEEVMIGKTAHLPTAPAYLLRAVTTEAAELSDDDGPVACRLLDPWLPVFYEDRRPLYEKVLIKHA